jgi:Apoptosis regulator proteins, Bcl-2 family
MADDGLKRIRGNFVFLVESIDVKSGLADLLYQMEVINPETFEEITNVHLTTQMQVRLLLRNLIGRKIGPDTYRKFREALQKTCGDFIVERLDNYDFTQDTNYDAASDEVDPPTTKLEDQVKMLNIQLSEHTQLILKMLEMQKKQESDGNCDVIDGGKKPKADIQHTLEDAERAGDVDDIFIKMFVVPPSKRPSLDAGDGAINSFVFPELGQLASTWELLTACRLSVDLVHYLAAQSTGREPPKPFSSVAISLRRVVDEVLANPKHKEFFDISLLQLDISELKGFGVFAAIFDELFSKSKEPPYQRLTWGRLVIWFAFCAYLVRGFPPSTKLEGFDVFGMYIWFFLDQRLSKDIASAGGWVSFRSMRLIEVQFR